VLGYRVGENLGDIAGAAAAYTKAIELATWARQHDAADRRALFDLSSAELRLRTVLVDNSHDTAAARRHLEEAERLNAALLAQEPASDRYGFVAVVIHRRIGDALAAAGRLGPAADRFETCRALATKFLSGPNGPNARQQRVLATIALAQLLARTDEPAASALADEAAKEMAQGRLGGSERTALADLGRVYMELGRRGPASARPDRLRTATTFLEQSTAQWREAKLPAALEERRARELAALDQDLKQCRAAID
jgi:hypothetical protein